MDGWMDGCSKMIRVDSTALGCKVNLNSFNFHRISMNPKGSGERDFNRVYNRVYDEKITTLTTVLSSTSQAPGVRQACRTSIQSSGG
jgi:hypothetical protein